MGQVTLRTPSPNLITVTEKTTLAATPSQHPAEIVAWRTTPIRVHWSVPLCAFVLGGGTWVPAFWAGFALLLMSHVVGHALVIRACGLRTVAVEVHGLGGGCRVHGADRISRDQRFLISVGGIAGQIMVLGVAWLLPNLLTTQPGEILQAVLQAWTEVNIALILANLLPMKGLDAEEAWARFHAWRNPQRIVIRPLTLRPASHSLEDELAFLEALDRVDPPISPGVEALVQRLVRSVNRQRSGNGRDHGGKT